MRQRRSITFRRIAETDESLIASWFIDSLETAALTPDIAQPSFWRAVGCSKVGEHVFVIYDEIGDPVGISMLYEINTKQKSAFGGTLIGNAKKRGRGIGHASKLKQFEYAFMCIGVERLYSRVLSTNTRMCRYLTSIGYSEIEGIAEESGATKTLMLQKSKWVTSKLSFSKQKLSHEKQIARR